MGKIANYKVKNIEDIKLIKCKLDIKWKFVCWLQTPAKGQWGESYSGLKELSPPTLLRLT